MHPRLRTPGDNDKQDEEVTRRLEEQWRLDEDDGPVFGAEGPEEQDRTLVDDYAEKYVHLSFSLLRN